MAQIAMGHGFLRGFAEALGLGGRPVRRIVVDLAVDSAVRLYVEEFANADSPAFEVLRSQLPRLNPHIQWVDRVAVENGGGTEVQIKVVQQEDTEARDLCGKVLDVLKHGTDQQRGELRAAIFRAGVL